MEEKSIINLKNVDYTKEPLFFGESLGLQRYDKFKYENLFSFFDKQLSFFWRPEEVNLSGKEKNDFETLSEHEKFIFTKNLGYQILLDSVQGRGIHHLREDLSNPEIEAVCNVWEFFETLHSFSYSYIIKNIYPNPSVIFDNVLTDVEIIKRTTSVTKYYDELIEKIPNDTLENKKKKLYLTIMSINILEGIRFYVSFACSYCFAENKKMEGNAKIISLINRDENIHLGFTQTLIKILKTNQSEGFVEIIKECEPIVIQMFKDAAKEEMDWADYLFKDGSMLGLNSDILKQYMKWLVNNRMRSIGLNPIFEKVENPILWIKNWTNSKDVQVGPQETEIESYLIGSLNNDLENLDFDF